MHTQTWSYEAIGIYIKVGFKIVKIGSFERFENDYEKEIPILMEKMKEKYLCEIEKFEI